MFHVSLDYILAGKGEMLSGEEFALPIKSSHILTEHELLHLTDFAKTLFLFQHTNEETDLLFDAIKYQVKFLNSVTQIKAQNKRPN
jgi:hypothetical protein